MALKLTIVLLSVFAILQTVQCQTNNVRRNLIQCYNSTALPEVLRANNRPPATLNVFIEFIRRLEDANPTLTPRELSILILQRLRQDGIMQTDGVTDSRVSIPFSPKRLEAYKSTVILQRYLPNTTLTLNTGDLSPFEICSLHYLISSNIENRVRGDESSTCRRSARYTSRIRRDVEAVEPQAPEASTGAPPAEDGNKDVETVEGVEGFGTRSISDTTDTISSCPIELGVVFTTYGTVKAGQVLAGLATGFNQETVLNADNRYAATIAGEIAEAALAQATLDISTGAAGGWNSSIDPKYYFLQRNTKLQLTDAEIRGSLDGLYMGLRLSTWTSRFTDLKMSQILDMYYSPQQKGVFDSTFKSCNRSILYSEMTTSETLQNQVYAFMGPLDDASQYGKTVSPSSYGDLTTASVSSFNNYLPTMNTNDLACTREETTIERVAADLLIFLDANWSYLTVQTTLSYLLDNIDVNRFGTRYTIYNGKDGSNIIDGTTNLLNFYSQYNLVVHEAQQRDFDYTFVYQTLERYAQSKLNNNTYMGAESTIVLLMPKNTPTESQNYFIDQRKQIIKQFLPDVTLLVLGSGSQSDYNSVVLTPSRDVFTLTDNASEEQLKQTGQTLLERIKSAPRSIVNPSCGSSFTGSASTFTLTDYVEPRGVNYYRIAPNYFYVGGETRNLKIAENSYGSIDVCISRELNKPNNQTGDCQTLRSSVRSIDVSKYCEGSSLTDCLPIFVSVTGNTTDTRCRDYSCRFPNNIKYSISLENVGCASGSTRLIASFSVLVALFLFIQF